jgi:Putative Flp pilus-assembly TadE/G-like
MNKHLRNEKGVTLLVVAAALVVMLGMCALAIDLVTGYLARVECQRAADAAALAGATQMTNCTSSSGGCVAGGAQEALATQNAVTVAAQNPVMGLAPTSSTMATAFTYPTPEEPQITVTVYRDSTHGDALPTMFAKIFGINSMNISASSTAEAYNPSGGSHPIGVGCVKPFLVPNCDPNYPVSTGDPTANTNCPCNGAGLPNGDCAGGAKTGYMSYYVYPAGTANAGQITHPGDCAWSGTRCSGGDIGAPWVLHDNAAPSQWYTIAFSTQSGNAYRTYIAQCAPQSVACNGTLSTLNGKKVGPTDQGISDLIHASSDGLNEGQDFMCSPSWVASNGSCPTSPSSPFTIIGGTNNPYNMAGQQFTQSTAISDSLSNVVLYDGSALSPGGSTVTVVGYMNLFIQQVVHSGNDDVVSGVVTQIGGCGGAQPGPGVQPPPVTGAGGGSFIPIRLIHQ